MQKVAAYQAVKQQTKANTAKQKRIKAAQKEASKARYRLHCILRDALSALERDQAIFVMFQAEQLSFATLLYVCRAHLELTTSGLHEAKSAIATQEEELQTHLAGQDESASGNVLWQQAQSLQASRYVLLLLLLPMLHW